jgi:hypothetical protein
MRKTYVAAVVSVVVLGAGVASAVGGPVTPSIDVTAKVSPSKAGTRVNPKPVTLLLSVVDGSDSGATAAKIKVILPDTLRLSSYRLRTCKASLENLRDDADLCVGSRAGAGSAHLVVGFATPAPTTVAYEVTPYVRNGTTILFVFRSAIGGNHVARGDIVGGDLRITLPAGLRQPTPGLYTAFEDFTVSLYQKTRTRSLVRSVGCPAARAHRIRVKVFYAANPLPPAVESASAVAAAPCTRAG